MKKVNEQTDSSSSEDETSTNSLKEAIDQEFLSNDLYSVKKNKIIPQSEVKTNKFDEKSLRSSKQEDQFTNFGFTATFQSFVAKKLDEILERNIEFESSETIGCCGNQKQKKNKNSGIKLLSTSKKFLRSAEVTKKYIKHKKPKESKQILEDEKALLKFREAAVDSERILNKSDTKAWVNRRPEPEFKYKRLKNGTLVEI
ncbi:uncharacterized protein LOC105432071 isoform X2 [Pogonomyrmex barbatus]|uniref:Protein CUSTOS n=1 Tax=Pogonomyrmex barbatus TaxID=144034 RepID=A0A6I9WPD5_9HYME|nr:uncharacterized protein LOC105432071 isoform X2 [Pogonomyrmex barbatus]